MSLAAPLALGTVDGAVTDFVSQVRRHLGDLSAEERDELTDGLSADLAELVDERGIDALPEPQEYAAELRAAAGLASVAVGPARREVLRPVGDALDAAGRRWSEFAGGLPGSPWEFAVSLRPAWWLVRAWVALQTLDLVFGGGSRDFGLSPIPTLGPFGLPLLIVAAVLSVQIGRGVSWPGRGGVVGRIVLLGSNLVAIALTPFVFGSLITADRAAAVFAGFYS